MRTGNHWEEKPKDQKGNKNNRESTRTTFAMNDEMLNRNYCSLYRRTILMMILGALAAFLHDELTHAFELMRLSLS